ncbi:MAG: UDP-N-acetylmuramate--L-alanine ligase, partial [Chloroflexia bacterium]|nr:UDP-N-acetylmuramate--L-alanine ligase [Chloroflexia bacterium]
MSGLAEMLQDAGYTITGSDSTDSPAVGALRGRGIQVVIGHEDPAFASGANVVVSTRRAELQAATELEAALAAGALVVKRGELLAMIANPLRTLAVAGTHGKSTTSGMLTIALRALGQDPGYSVGAKIPGVPGNTAAGSGEFMVVEADEFDRSFLWLRPEVSIITSVSFDHPDIYADQRDYDGAFLTFARQTRPGGTLVIAADEPGCLRLIAVLRDGPTTPFSIVTFGESDDADWRVARVDDHWTFHPPTGEHVEARLGVPGAHNARNAIAAVAALHAAGYSPKEAVQALERFTGVGRRFEHKGQDGGIDVVDDYAHHPEEIVAVVAAARLRYPDRRLFVVHQPHTYTRTKLLLAAFAQSLDLADEVILLDIYPGGETDDLGVSSNDLLALLHVTAQAVVGPEEAAIEVARRARTGDVVMTLGAGDITLTGARTLELLGERTSARVAKPRPTRDRPPVATVEIPDAPQLKVMRDAPMSMYTTMRLGGLADFLVRAPLPEDIVAAMRWAAGEGLPVTVIGGGSNLLVGDDGIRGLVIVARTPGERAGQLLTVEEGGDTV